MTSMKRIAGIFFSAFILAIAVEYSPNEIKQGLGFAGLVILFLWFFGYIDVKQLIEGKKSEEA